MLVVMRCILCYSVHILMPSALNMLIYWGLAAVVRNLMWHRDQKACIIAILEQAEE